MVRVDFRIPQELKDLCAADAARLGLDFSEYVRQTLLTRIAWTTAIHLASTDLPELDPTVIAALVRRVRAELEHGQGPPPP